MNKAQIFFATLALAALSACSVGGDGGNSAQEAPLAGARIGAPFTLIDQDGKRVTWDSFKGKYRLVYFGYTFCPDVCPVDLQKITQAFTQFEKKDPARAAKVQPVFITVDPERDTAPVLKTYVGAFHPRLVGLTGTPQEIAEVAKDFAVIYGKEGTGKDYLVSHSRTPYLFGPNGDPIALIPVDNTPPTEVYDYKVSGSPTKGTIELKQQSSKSEGTPDAILATLEQWVK